MDHAVQPYRLEVAVRRVYGLTPLIASTSSMIAVEVHFLDFPGIVVHPQGLAVGDTVTYNVCHKADFRMAAEQAAAAFPAVCQCNLSAEADPALSHAAEWSCPCTLLPPPSGNSAAAPQRTYTNCVIRNPSEKIVGYAEMSCVVFPLPLAPVPATTERQPMSLTPPVATTTPAPSSSSSSSHTSCSR